MKKVYISPITKAHQIVVRHHLLVVSATGEDTISVTYGGDYDGSSDVLGHESDGDWE